MKMYKEPQEARPVEKAESAEKLRVLLAEDNPDLRECLVEVLNRNGYEVSAVENGQQAWEAAQTVGFDLIVTDHDMPRLTGAELALRVRAAGMSLPIIVISGVGEYYSAARCRFLGIKAVLQKPFPLEDLTQAVGRTLCADREIAWRERPRSGFSLEAVYGPLLESMDQPSTAEVALE